MILPKAVTILLGVASVFSWSQTVQPVIPIPAPNANGWIKLNRGNNASDFYTYYTGDIPAKSRKTFPDATFKYSGDTITASGSPTGHIIFKQPFSHYKIRYQIRWPGGLGNCGMLLHIQENDSAMWGQFPRSIESQGDPGQGMGQIWAIGRVWVTVRAKAGPQYDPASPEIDYGGANDGARMITGIHGYGQPRPAQLATHDWVIFEADVHGSDSISHSVMGEVQIKYRNPRVAPRNNANQVEKLLKDGLLGWQSEGASVQYRFIEIKLYPEDPLYKTLYTTGLNQVTIRQKSSTSPLLEFRDGVLRVRASGSEDRQSNSLGQLLLP